jgi:hypothetical protein
MPPATALGAVHLAQFKPAREFSINDATALGL